jgi:hypothetical protein
MGSGLKPASQMHAIVDPHTTHCRQRSFCFDADPADALCLTKLSADMQQHVPLLPSVCLKIFVARVAWSCCRLVMALLYYALCFFLTTAAVACLGVVARSLALLPAGALL